MRKAFPFDKFVRGYQPLDLTTEAGLLRAQSLRFRAGGFRKRDGFVAFGDAFTPGTGKPRFLVGNFSTGNDLLVAYPDKLLRYSADTEKWSVIDMASIATLSGDGDHAWSGVTLFDKLYLTQGRRLYDVATPPALTSAGIMCITSPGAAPALMENTPAGRDIFAYAGRLFILHSHDSDGNMLSYRGYYSAPGDPSDFYTNGGYFDLAEDGYPLLRGLVGGGRAIIFKGNANGGSIVFGSATSSVYFPVTFETAHGVGLLGARTLCRIGLDTVAFLSHDGLYAMSGTNAPEPLSDFAVNRALLDQIDLTALDEAFAFYNQLEGDLVIVVPYVSGSLVAFTYNVKSKIWTGPESLTGYHAATYSSATVLDSWDSTPDSDTWDAGDDTAWDATPESRIRPVMLLARNDGKVAKLDPEVASDMGEAVSVMLETGDRDFEGETFAVAGGYRGYKAADAATLVCVDALVVRYRDLGDFLLTASISADGGASWKGVCVDKLVVGSGDGSTKRVRVFFPQLTGKTFRVRLTSNSATDKVEYVGATLEGDYAGQD